jgi:hypothetical protein
MSTYLKSLFTKFDKSNFTYKQLSTLISEIVKRLDRFEESFDNYFKHTFLYTENLLLYKKYLKEITTNLKLQINETFNDVNKARALGWIKKFRYDRIVDKNTLLKMLDEYKNILINSYGYLFHILEKKDIYFNETFYILVFELHVSLNYILDILNKRDYSNVLDYDYNKNNAISSFHLDLDRLTDFDIKTIVNDAFRNNINTYDRTSPVLNYDRFVTIFEYIKNKLQKIETEKGINYTWNKFTSTKNNYISNNTDDKRIINLNGIEPDKILQIKNKIIYELRIYEKAIIYYNKSEDMSSTKEITRINMPPKIEPSTNSTITAVATSEQSPVIIDSYPPELYPIGYRVVDPEQVRTNAEVKIGGNKFKSTKNKITVIYKKKKYTRVIYISERKKYVKINKTYLLLSKLKKV